MNQSETTAELFRRLETDEAIKTFCLREFGRRLSVLRRFDNHKPPGETDCPWAHLEHLFRSRSNVRRIVTRTYLLSCGVHSEDVCAGESLAADLRELIETAIQQPGLGKVVWAEEVLASSEEAMFDNICSFTIEN